MIYQLQLKKQDSMMMKIQIVLLILLLLNQNLMKTIQLQHLLLLQEIRPLLFH